MNDDYLICIQPDRLDKVLAMSVTQDDESVSLFENMPHQTLGDRRQRSVEFRERRSVHVYKDWTFQ